MRIDSARIDFDPKSLSLTRETTTTSSPQKPTPAKTDTEVPAEARNAAREFETMFMDLVMKSMRATAAPEEDSNAMGIYQDMLDNEYTKNMTDNRDFGVQSMILDWMKTVDPQALKKGLLTQNGGAGSFAARQAMDQYKAQMMTNTTRIKSE